jgi:hypothetical protein
MMQGFVNQSREAVIGEKHYLYGGMLSRNCKSAPKNCRAIEKARQINLSLG